MIVISGSWLVKDSGKRNDVDVIYLTRDIGEYVVLLMRKKMIESELEKKLGIKVSFSPYIVISPTIIGNVFLAITLLRYPLHKPHAEHILKLVLRKRNKRWLLLHFAFAVLGLLSSNNPRDHTKYCSMIAENLLYIENTKIPNSWRDTIKIGYIIASKYKLHNLSALLLSCIKYAKSERKHMLAQNVDSSRVVHAVGEYLKLIEVRSVKELRGGVGEAFRKIHELIAKHVLGLNMKWRACSSTIIILMYPEILTYIMINHAVRARAVKVFTLCRQQIPVLSPFMHP